MFSVSQQQSAAFSQQVILTDEKNQTQATVLPACGAILHGFTIRHHNEILNLVEGYESDADFRANAESKGFRNIKMSPFACRIRDAQYLYNGELHTIHKFLLNGSAIHGLLYNESFTVVKTWADEERAGVLLAFEYKGTDPGYPYHFTCEIMYELGAGNALTLTTVITNKDKTAIPMQDGWHPYFTFGGSINDLELFFNSDSLVEFDDALVPTGILSSFTEFGASKKLGDRFFDNCFTLKPGTEGPACTLTDTVKKLMLSVWPDQSYPYLQLYTPPHRQSIAVENISAAPDAFNNGMGLLVLQPEATAQFATTYQITSLL